MLYVIICAVSALGHFTEITLQNSAARLNLTRLAYRYGERFSFYCGSRNIRDLCLNNSYHLAQQFYFFILYVLQFKQATKVLFPSERVTSRSLAPMTVTAAGTRGKRSL